jgi:hypothetical protein
MGDMSELAEDIAETILAGVSLANAKQAEELLLEALNEQNQGVRIVAISAVLSNALCIMVETLEIDSVTALQVVVELMGAGTTPPKAQL